MSKDAIKNAAVAFAADHGPLSAALQGDVAARAELGLRLLRCLHRAGLEVRQVHDREPIKEPN